MSEVYNEVKSHFANDDEVIVNIGKGAQGIKYGKKLFVMFYKGELVVKLSQERVTELVSTDQARRHDVGTGEPMKDWAKFPVSMKNRWIEYCEESKSYVMK
ncbi:MAG: hypothetical protein HeimC2_12850 [Candidatus Heimdallarchaeota archaeon LC_2]|nr:MAG: hypothetical protein HeimC2_12850 [Candidatus Heimdallarchaeota archaeon LC_2]